MIEKGREALHLLTKYLEQLQISDIESKEEANPDAKATLRPLTTDLVVENLSDGEIEQVSSPATLCIPLVTARDERTKEVVEEVAEYSKTTVSETDAPLNIPLRRNDKKALSWTLITTPSPKRCMELEFASAVNRNEQSVSGVGSSASVQCDPFCIETDVFATKLKTRILTYCDKYHKSCRHIYKYFSRYDVHNRGLISLESFDQLCALRLRFQLTASEMTRMRLWSYPDHPDLISYRTILAMCFGEEVARRCQEDVSAGSSFNVTGGGSSQEMENTSSSSCYLTRGTCRDENNSGRVWPKVTSTSSVMSSNQQSSHVSARCRMRDTLIPAHSTVSTVDKLMMEKYSTLTDVCYKSTMKHTVSYHPSVIREKMRMRSKMQSMSTNRPRSYSSTKRAVIHEFELQKIIMDELYLSVSEKHSKCEFTHYPPSRTEIMFSNMLKS